MLGFEHHDIAITLTSIGEVLLMLGGRDLALEHFERALSIQKNSNEEDNILTAKLLNTIGNLYLQRGNTEISMTMFIEASRINRDAILISPNTIYPAAVLFHTFNDLEEVLSDAYDQYVHVA